MAKKTIARNRQAYRNFEMLDDLEAGIELKGTEIKSIREGNVSFRDSFVDIKDNQMWLVGFYIAPYSMGNIWNHAEERKRRLLLHKYEIKKWDRKIRERGFTIIPVEIYLKDGKAKLKICLARGKNAFDKRHDIKNKDMKRDMDRFRKNFR